MTDRRCIADFDKDFEALYPEGFTFFGYQEVEVVKNIMHNDFIYSEASAMLSSGAVHKAIRFHKHPARVSDPPFLFSSTMLSMKAAVSVAIIPGTLITRD